MSTVQVFAPTDPRLGRHIIHDDRSWNYRITVPALPTAPVMHERHEPIWDQGQVGSCTANAALGMLVTGPLWKPTYAFTEIDAVELYKEETRIDDAAIPGHYPPDDTGSSGLYSCKALQKRGLIKSYGFMFTTAAVLGQLGLTPVSIGIPWYESMFNPNRNGVVSIKGRVAGGHQICFDGIDPKKKLVRFANSWGTGWGKSGWGYMSFTTLDHLLKQGGDAVTVAYS